MVVRRDRPPHRKRLADSQGPFGGQEAAWCTPAARAGRAGAFRPIPIRPFRRHPHVWASTLFDEVTELGYACSYPSFARQVRLAVRPHCEACSGVKGWRTSSADSSEAAQVSLDRFWATKGVARLRSPRGVEEPTAEGAGHAGQRSASWPRPKHSWPCRWPLVVVDRGSYLDGGGVGDRLRAGAQRGCATPRSSCTLVR